MHFTIRGTILSVVLLVLSWTNINAQQHVQGQISSLDSVQLQVIRTFPDSFPNISIVFRATGPSGKIIQNLDSSNVNVTEDGQACRIISVNRITSDWAVNTALVIDHSGSMRLDDILRRHWDSLPPSAFKNKMTTMREYTGGEVNSDSAFLVREAPANPIWYHPPMWYAQRAALSYVNATDPAKDKISVIGFSNNVDEVVSLTGDRNKVTSSINGMSTDGETAFYDAIWRALDEADKGSGIRCVIAMTDGKDNASRRSGAEVIAKARELKIPVYIIGLGDVDKSPLQSLARQTEGISYFTNDASTLASIYARITLHLQSIYEVVYESPSMASVDSTRDVQLNFEIGDAYHPSRPLALELPESVLNYLAQKEREAEIAQMVVEPATTPVIPEEGFPWALVGIGVAVVSAGIITGSYLRKNKKKGPTIVKLYPNPTIGPFTIDFDQNLEIAPGSITVTNAKGQIVHVDSATTGTSLKFDLSHCQDGIYTVVFTSGIGSSSSNFVISK